MNRFLLTHSPSCLPWLVIMHKLSICGQKKKWTLAFIYRYWFRLQLHASVELFEMEIMKPSLSAVSQAPVESIYVYLTLQRALHSHTLNISLICSHAR